MHSCLDVNRSGVVRSFFADAASNLGTGLIVIPGWMAITCATAGRTSQVSASTLVAGLGANAARARNIGSGTGLSVEMARTNLALNSDTWTGTGWSAGSMTRTASQADPAGGSVASKWTSAGGDFTNFQTGTTARTYSAWVKGSTGTPPYAHFQKANSILTWVDITTTTWARAVIVYASDQATGQIVCRTDNVPTGSGPTGASTFLTYGAQAEASVAYPSSYFPTAGATGARAADVLSVAAPANVAPGGFFELDMLVAPNYADTEQSADHNLVYFDTNNRIFIQQSTKKVVLRIGGADVLSSALTWSREAPIRIHALHRPGGRKLDVAGATSGNGSSGLQSAAAAISLPGTSYLMGSNTGAEECADLRHLMIFNP